MRILILSALLGCVALIGACGSSDNPLGTEATVVQGEVTSIQNDIAADGGITLDIDVSQGGTDTLLFPSLFTAPPPSEEIMRLYDVVRRVEPGDIVRAEGVRQGQGLQLQRLWILDGQP